jgi:hypothetical protein
MTLLSYGFQYFEAWLRFHGPSHARYGYADTRAIPSLEGDRGSGVRCLSLRAIEGPAVRLTSAKDLEPLGSRWIVFEV